MRRFSNLTIIIAIITAASVGAETTDPRPIVPSDSRICGDFDGNGMIFITDLVDAINYLYQDGAGPMDYDEADCDGYHLYTLNDLAHLLRNQFGGGEPPICPPGPERLDGPVNDGIYLHTYETAFPAAEIFPPGVSEVKVHFHLVTDETLRTASLAFQLRVGGEIPTIDSVTLPVGDMTTFLYASKVDHDSGRAAIGLISVSPGNEIPPGTHEYGFVHLSVPPLDLVWRPIEIAWDSLTPDQDGEYPHYPFVVGEEPGMIWRPTIARFPCLGEIRGNIDYDPEDLININDLVYMVKYMFQQGTPPICFEETDVEVNLQLDIEDLVYLVSYMFQDGPPPALCP